MHNAAPIIVHKNRKRAIWSLAILFFFVPISAWLVFLGLQPGQADIGWSLVLFGALGAVAFGGSTILIIQTMRAPWHLAIPGQILRMGPEELAAFLAKARMGSLCTGEEER